MAVSDKLNSAKKNMEFHPMVEEALREARAEQWRFKAEPVFSKTGVGYLRSVGVRDRVEAKKRI